MRTCFLLRRKEGESLGARKTDITPRPDGAHFLHGRSGLNPVLRVPVDHPSALCWIPRKEVLLVGTKDQTLVEVDPVMGTRVLNILQGSPERICVAAKTRRYGALCSEGRWSVGTLGSAPEYSGTTELETVLQCLFFGKYFIVVGDFEGSRLVHLYADGVRAACCRIPDGAKVYKRADGKLGAARLTGKGLELSKVRSRGDVSSVSATEHQLYVCHPNLFGWTSHGAVAWSLTERVSVSFGLLDMNIGCLHGSGKWAAIGTVGGIVGLVDMATPMTRRTPYLSKAHDAPVHSVAFSSRGQWFASAADRVHLWSWESNEAP